MNGKGATIFLSHSSKDLKKVRWIRNEFEKLGQNPLTFSLKCLDDNDPSTQKELLELLKREIESREWFVFCARAPGQGRRSCAGRRSSFPPWEPPSG